MAVAAILAAVLIFCGAAPTLAAPSATLERHGEYGVIRGDLGHAGFAGARVGTVHWRDLDGDGDQDLAVVAREGSRLVARFLRNDGNGFLSAGTPCTAVAESVFCEGDQSGGVKITVSAKTYLWIRNLTSDVTPATGVHGVEAVGTSGARVYVTFLGGGHAIVTQGNGAHGITARSTGVNGPAGGDDWGIIWAEGGDGTDGGTGGKVDVTNDASITTNGVGSHGILAESQGGSGGRGGDATFASIYSEGGDGATGGRGGDIAVDNSGAIATHGDFSHGIVATSRGGAGGNGGDAAAIGGAIGGDGGYGGIAGWPSIHNSGAISTEGLESHGILAQSLGAGGGSGGDGGGIYGEGGGATGSGSSFAATIMNSGTVTTRGDGSNGIFAQAIGGFGGGGGGGGGIASFGGQGAYGGNAYLARIDNSGNVSTDGKNAAALFSQSIGGGGGSGAGSGGIYSLGGQGSAGGNGGAAKVYNTGTLATHGDSASAIFVQSIGGGGGRGAGSGGVVSIGGGGSATGNGGEAIGSNTGAITTEGVGSHGIFVQSIGGGGGSGAASGGMVSIGGSGNSGGKGGEVTVTNTGTIGTEGLGAVGIFAQSVGGGGGYGGSSGGLASFGGKGSVTSNGGRVTVVNSGNITTGSGSDSVTAGSQAIFAQSIGGGGGTGGTSGGLFSIGGSAGGGGNASVVRVENSGRLVTRDANSSGISAQSVGGGGGNGGGAVAGLNALPTVSIGGSGGSGGRGDSVIVDSHGGSIATEGDQSYGILAQSIGGGGGNGGFAVSGSLVVSPVKVAVGGSGGGGGAGGAVVVTGTSDIATSGSDAHGIVAQSVGGGGGNGGFTVGASYGGGVNWSIGVGGSGGVGGNASVVRVGSPLDPILGTIEVSGDRSCGIVAQSIGGGGGNGGFTVTGALLGGTTVDLSFGGKGGAGGRGEAVDVATGATIVTSGANGHGILAQSIGGGGGAGGWTLAAGVTAFGGTGLSIGGAGGPGVQGGKVSVLSQGGIETFGEFAHGILAQSIGGGGGAGGMSGSAMVNFSGAIPMPPQIPVTVSSNFGVSIGGKGGSGGTADSVRVTNDGAIVTHGGDSQGIVAQSIGGGGGAGGKTLAATANIGIPTGEPGPEIHVDFALAIGGTGGTGNHAGAVDVANTGRIDTEGDAAHGVLAQSIGGGGGIGGNARSMTLGIDPSEWVGAQNPMEISPSANISVGGKGAGGGDGGRVTVDNDGAITTRGADAYGILAQSIGGGGGAGGGGYHGLDWGEIGVPDWLVPFLPDLGDASNLLNLQDATVVVGGQGGSSGHGNAVAIRNAGTLRTFGDGSIGILAQSIGGGGGIGGVGAQGDGTVGVGGRGGAAGNGGAVTVESSGRVETFGTAAHAILAQSIGGGGGIGGNVDRGLTDFGLNVALGANGGSAGNGGTVLVNANGDIVTHGMGASGIVAQSVGGGGGIGGDLGFGLGFGGSVGGDGSGDAVTVDLSGSVTTLGDGAHGIVAQSAGGRHSGGAVDVTVDGDVLAYGKDAHGIVVQSRGNSGSGDIDVLVESGTVQGGAEDGAGLLILDGRNNRVTNHGTIRSVLGAEGTAIRASGSGNETIENLGRVTGLVDLAGGANHFNNRAGALFEAGTVVNLGHGGILRNEGVFAPGGDAAATTTLYGDYVQTGTGTYEVTLNGGALDKLVIHGGSAALDGKLEVVADHDAYVDGTAYDVIEAEGVSGAFDEVVLPKTAFLNFDLESVGTTGVRVTADVKSFGEVTRHPLERSVASALDGCLTHAEGDMAHMIGRMQLSTTPEQVSEAFYSLSPASYDNLSRGAFQSARLLQDNLELRMDASRSRPSPEQAASTGRAYEGGRGWWLGGGYVGADQSESGGYLKHHYSTSAALGGYERAAGRAIAGASFGFARADVGLKNEHADGTANGYFGSLYGGMLWNRTFAQSVLSFGTNDFDNRRDVHVGLEERMATSRHGGTTLSALVTGGTRLPAGRWGIEPFASLRYARTSEKAFTEAGAGSVNLVVDKHATPWMQSDLGVRFTTSVLRDAYALLPEVHAAWSHDFGLDRDITAAFQADPSMPFTLSGAKIDSEGLVAGAGLTYTTTSGWKASVRYERMQRGDYRSNGLMVRLGSGF